MKLWNETTPRKNILCGQFLHSHMGQLNSAREKSPLGVYCFICCHSFDQIIGADTFGFPSKCAWCQLFQRLTLSLQNYILSTFQNILMSFLWRVHCIARLNIGYKTTQKSIVNASLLIELLHETRSSNKV